MYHVRVCTREGVHCEGVYIVRVCTEGGVPCEGGYCEGVHCELEGVYCEGAWYHARVQCEEASVQ